MAKYQNPPMRSTENLQQTNHISWTLSWNFLILVMWVLKLLLILWEIRGAAKKLTFVNITSRPLFFDLKINLLTIPKLPRIYFKVMLESYTHQLGNTLSYHLVFRSTLTDQCCVLQTTRRQEKRMKHFPQLGVNTVGGLFKFKVLEIPHYIRWSASLTSK